MCKDCELANAPLAMPEMSASEHRLPVQQTRINMTFKTSLSPLEAYARLAQLIDSNAKDFIVERVSIDTW